MKYSLHSIGFVALALFVMVPMKVNALGPAPVSLSVDEAGNGQENLAFGPFSLVPGSMASDPGPGGKASALTYQGFTFFNTLITGDLFLTEAGGNSDVIRFNFNSTTGFGSLVFYSLPGEGQLADTGLPSAFYTNTFSILENPNGPTTYTPTAGQPGYIPVFPGFSYLINSPSAVPEGG
ncbi:MAG: hypothetical protein ACXWHF_00820, partial [Chthoniobacterales bacterium]